MNPTPQPQPPTPPPAPSSFFPPQAPEQPDAPTPPPAPTSPTDPKKSPLKWIIIGIAGVLLLAGLIFGTKFAADTSAKLYTDSVRAHLDSTFVQTSRAKRIEMLNKPVTLTFVPLGSVLSDKYKVASEKVKPLYDKGVVLARDSIEASKAYNEEFPALIKDIQDALAISTRKITADGKEVARSDFADIETGLKNDLKVADMLDAAANKAASLEVLERAGNRDVIVEDLKQWATIRREHAGIAVAYITSVTGWAEESLKSIEANTPAKEYNEASNFQALLNQNVIDYGKISNKTVTDLTASLDAIEAKGYSKDVQKQLDEANKVLSELDALLKELK